MGVYGCIGERINYHIAEDVLEILKKLYEEAYPIERIRLVGEPYLDRSTEFDYKIVKGDLCYRLFEEHGFEWGGEWGGKKDYQHFDLPDRKVEKWYPDFFTADAAAD